MQWSSLAARVRRTTAFAVLAVVLACTIPALASAVDYVALGDSYSSGTGTRSYFDTGCERSNLAYPSLIKGSLGSSFSFQACGGAKVQDVLDDQLGTLSASTQYVTISIGGNDAGFSSVITECAKPLVSCDGNIDAAQSYIANTLPGRLDTVYNSIRSKAPNAIVAVVGYPRLFNGDDCNALTFFSSSEETRLNTTADQMANLDRARARAHGFTYVDVRQAFTGHAVCDSTEWLNGLSSPTSESYHPNTLGHSSGYAPTVRAALLAAPEPTDPVGGNGRIAFASTRGGDSDVWVVNADGQFPIDLTNNAAADIDPAWSPDGTKVAFVSNRDGDNEIYVMNGDGSGVTKLTNNTNDEREPAWSPNGAYIAFRSDRTGNNEVFTMTSSGASQTNVTNNSASDFGPDWSPDGAELAWQRFTSGSSTGQGNEVLKANSNGQGQINLTNNASSINDGRPNWSPDGATIAFHSNRATGGLFKIYTMGATGGTATQRSTGSGNDTKPVYAPKNNLIAFSSTRDGNDEIYTMTTSGGSITNRTLSLASDVNPSWQADSTPPATTIGAQPSGAIADATPTFTISGSELGGLLQCSLDNGAYTACASPYTTTTLADGPHSLSVRAVDPAGNTDATPAVRTFTVDTVAPGLAVQCAATVALNGTAQATVTASDGGSGFAAGTDPSGAVTLITSVPGTQSYSVTATDLAGNATTRSCSYVVRYPDPGVPALGEGTSPNAGTFLVTWAPSASASYPLRYSLQRRSAGGDWEDVASGLADPRRAFAPGAAADEGTWRFRVKGIDAVNGTETGWTEPSDPVKVDQTGPQAPAITLDRAPEDSDGGWFRDAVTATTEDRGDPDLRDGSVPAGVDPASVAAAEELSASTTVRRAVRDRVGNVSAEATREVRVDTDAPTVDLACPATAYVLQDIGAMATATDDGSGLAHDPTGTVAIDTAHAGPQRVSVTATDRVGHEATATCVVDVAYPAPGTPELAEGSTPNDGAYTVGWKRSAPAGYPVRYVLERRDAAAGADWQTVASDIAADRYSFHTGEAADEGTWTFRVKAVDGELVTPWSDAGEPVAVDESGPAAPSVTADRAPDASEDGGWYRDSVTVTTVANGDPDLRDGSAPAGVDADSVAAPVTLDHSATLDRTVRDHVGNASAQATLRVQVDADAPTVALDCASPVDLLSDASVTVRAADASSGLRQDPSGTVAVDTTQVGTQVVERTAVDRVGHETTERCSVEVRYPAPGAPKVTAGGSPNGGDFTVSWKRSAPASYPIRYVLERRDAAAGSDWELVADGIDGDAHSFHAGQHADEGTWTFRVRGVDGDVHTPWSQGDDAVVVDESAPAAPKLSTDRSPEYASDGGWYRDTATVSTADLGDPALRDGSTPSGVDPASVEAPRALTGTATVSRTVRDRAGNISPASSLRVQVDATRPALALACPASVVLRGTGKVVVTASDAESGLATNPSGTVAIDTSRVGVQTITRTAVDRVGHERTASCDVRVQYASGGLQQPVNSDGSSIFKLGSTVPLKIALTDAAGAAVPGVQIVVEMERTTTSVLGSVVEETLAATPTNGKEFGFDTGAGRYSFNLSTKPLSTGTWNVKLTFDDGTVHRTQISLR